MARELGPSLQGLPGGSTVIVHCDIEPIVQVRQALEAAGWEVFGREFSPTERAFRLTAHRRAG